jgi:hypothetical protein
MALQQRDGVALLETFGLGLRCPHTAASLLSAACGLVSSECAQWQPRIGHYALPEVGQTFFCKESRFGAVDHPHRPLA